MHEVTYLIGAELRGSENPATVGAIDGRGERVLAAGGPPHLKLEVVLERLICGVSETSWTVQWERTP